MAMLMLGDAIDASSALAMGLVNQVVPRADLEARALQIAARLAAGAPRALANVKDLVYLAITGSLDAQLVAEQRCFRAAAGTADFREGICAFFERRPARFTGS